MDFKLDPLTGDLAFENGDLVLVDGTDAIIQQIRIRLNFFLGEWFLDSREGTPWYQILGERPDLGLVYETVRQVLITTPGVESVDTLRVSMDDPVRQLNVTFTLNGGEIDSTDFAPFIVELS